MPIPRAGHALAIVLGPLLAVAVAAPAGADDPRAALVDELVELHPDATTELGTPSLTLDTARGVPAGVHVLITGLEPGDTLSFRLDGLDDAAWFRLIDVPVEENTGLASRTEQFDGRPNPHVIREAPFRVFEVLRPVTDAIVAEATTIALRVEVAIAADVPRGSRTLTIRLRMNDAPLPPLAWTLDVHGAVVPPAGRDTYAYTNWFSPDEIATRHGIEPWSEAFWPMLARYATLMHRGRQNVFWVRWTDMFDVVDGVPTLRRERLVRYVDTFTDAGLWWIEGAPFATRPGGDWSRPDLELKFEHRPATAPEGVALLRAAGAPLMALLRERAWVERWVQHLADEPTDVNAADYRRLAAIMRDVMPGVPLVEATMCTSVAGAIDIWCPQVQAFQQERAFFDARRDAGDRCWVYTCLVPGGPWLNRLLDMERLRQVYLGWSLVRDDLDGYLHWGLNHYKADPFAQSVVDHPAMPNTTNRLPAGDTHVIYPGDDGPWSGQRFEAHRIGMEDAELLRQLKRVDPERARAIIDAVCRAFDDYDTDVAAYRRAKRDLLTALDRE
ncbi:MAG: DUF4091 domain-containing protein [Phycisphaerales bacterium]|nr:DUF4091 domain-containing protein [Phycisphaerales bacterium]